ncbi:unnamed protein product [Staurois parvus]|uniref:Uncharacterized protein n=1 Tax=Staurois parvus TaxID=386267 RepID=A0ABN9FJ67_9NEOB|nr:unnamed protein product [Staurois parvus]
MLVASNFLDYRDDWHHSGLQSALWSAGRNISCILRFPRWHGLPEKAVEGSGGGGASFPAACNCSCRHHPGITIQSPVMYQYVAGPCWVYMLCSFFFSVCSLWAE